MFLNSLFPYLDNLIILYIYSLIKAVSSFNLKKMINFHYILKKLNKTRSCNLYRMVQIFYMNINI